MEYGYFIFLEVSNEITAGYLEKCLYFNKFEKVYIVNSRGMILNKADST